MAAVSDYSQLVPKEHQKPNFLAVLAVLIQGQVDLRNFYEQVPFLYDLDLSYGVYLDVIGLWVGVSRVLAIPLEGVFFAWDTDDVGWDQGQWQGPGDSGNTLYVLADDDYQLLLRAVIASNHWDGTVPGAYEVWNIAFGGLGYTFLLQDNQDMSIDVIVLGPELSAVEKALLTSGELGLKPAGVRINGYYKPSDPTIPMFGFDAENDLISGWDEGGWAIPI